MTDQTKGTTMSESEMRIKVAESVGFEYSSLHDTSSRAWSRIENGSRVWYCGDKIPNYPQDLNAMHEVEKTLNPAEWASYMTNLTDYRLPQFIQQQAYIHATAAQRCEAYLRVKGLWHE